MKKLALIISTALMVTACGGDGDEGENKKASSPGTKSLTTVTDTSLENLYSNTGDVDASVTGQLLQGVISGLQGGFTNENINGLADAQNNGQQTQSIPCNDGNGELVLTFSADENQATGSVEINECNVSDDPNVIANGRFNLSMRVESESFKFHYSGDLDVTDRNRAETIFAIDNLEATMNSEESTMSSTVTSGGQTHKIMSSTHNTYPIKEQLRIEGAGSSWIEIVREGDSNDELSTCSVSKSDNLTISDDEACDLLD
ncbi:hypothetical protein [Veronia pacifica]|uniref:Lipoprotein n=1 Tax=Veronia pacifica TaxID=1080227 RepID=A0A1C3E9K5_9GAMM|nr:hypothetical protein [Veronia pacifica]ODA29904.1 hypothetical protein A8L45_21340 [Veronia pacifica]